MKIYRVTIKTTNSLQDAVYSEKTKKYIDVRDGVVYVSERDLKYVMDNYPFVSIEEEGLIYERPCEIKGVEE